MLAFDQVSVCVFVKLQRFPLMFGCCFNWELAQYQMMVMLSGSSFSLGEKLSCNVLSLVNNAMIYRRIITRIMGLLAGDNPSQ